MDLSHPIFNVPNKVAFEYEDEKQPPEYKDGTSILYPKGMGPVCKTAKFEKNFVYWNPIIVNHEGYFTDIPGLESISEGRAEKCIGSLSLARQGRYFYWGYSIDPGRMTEPAKLTFLNTLHYMHEKRGSLTLTNICTPRRELWIYRELCKGEGYKRGIEEHLPGSLLEECRKDYKPTLEGAEEWLKKNLDYVFSGKEAKHKGQRYSTMYEVDADARVLGTANFKRESLEAWMEWVKGADTEKSMAAKKCLQRYVHPDIFPKDGDWAAWYKTYKDRIVFIESTGFWWQEDPRILEKESRPQ